MTRRPRIDAPGLYHHVMNRGVDHRRIFFSDRDRLDFGRLLGEIHERFGVETVAYCLLDNHFHLIVRSADGRLSEAMRHLGSVFASRANRRVQRDGHLFGARFHSIVIDTDAYLLTATRYVHRNALDVRGVNDPCEYRWSSHRAYLGLRPTASWLSPGRVLSFFDGPAEFARFVRSAPRRSGPIDHVVLPHAIDSLIGRHDGDAVERRALAQVVLALASDVVSSDERRQIESLLPERTPGAWASARSRARRRASEHPELVEISESALCVARDAHAAGQRITLRRAG